jgi:hypothetical protein
MTFGFHGLIHTGESSFFINADVIFTGKPSQGQEK